MVDVCKVSIIIIGEQGVGKTSLLLRFISNSYRENVNSTIIDCRYKDIVIQDKQVKLEIWDTAGQDRFRSITKQYLRKADGALLVYDVTDITTFLKLSSWLEDLRSTNEEATVIIVGNKNEDLSKKTVTVNAVKNYAKQEELEFIESSAKNGDNITDIFETLTRKVLEAKRIIAPSSSETAISSSASTSSCANSCLDDYVVTLKSDLPKDSNSNLTEVTASGVATTKFMSTVTTQINTFSSDTLPPIVHLPADTIKLHVERPKKKKKKDCC